MKVLLVDDERLLLDSLEASIDWQSQGITWVGKATSGESALELCKNNLPDLVITDIKMSPMDGLTLIRHINKLYPKTKTIIMSSYNDFEYAQEAIELGVSQYLLKLTTVKEELLYAIQRIKNELEKIPIAFSSRENDHILNFIKGEHDEKLMSSLNAEHYAIFIMQLTPDEEEKPACIEEMRTLLSSFNPDGLTALNSQYCFLLYPLDDCEITAVRNIMIRIKSRLSLSFEDISIVASSIVPRSQISLAYKQAKRMADRSFFEGKNSVMIWGEQDDQGCFPYFLPAPYQEFIFDVASGNHVLLRKKLYALYADKNRLQSIGRRNLLNMVEYIMMQIYKTLPEEADHTDLFNAIQRIVDIRNLNNLRHITEWILQQISERSSYAHFSPIIKRCIDYIYENYDQPLSLTVIAQALNVSTTYLSKSFNLCMGKNITDFIHERKMEYAKNMLIFDKYMEINEIASKLSFDSASYFTYLFRNHTGYSPKEFRKMSQENKTMPLNT